MYNGRLSFFRASPFAKYAFFFSGKLCVLTGEICSCALAFTIFLFTWSISKLVTVANALQS